ncbi:MAG: uL15 family ribosomal protein [Candidatus Bathyarchaeia archaeon]
MATRLRKVRKMRGSRTHGWGISGQHRKHGMKGGRGNAGRFKHKWTRTIKYGLKDIGKTGFKCPTSKPKPYSINVDELDQLIKSFDKKSLTKDDTGRLFIDLSKLGYEKLLGAGKIKYPVSVIVNECSEKAKEKIEKVGGTVKILRASVG